MDLQASQKFRCLVTATLLHVTNTRLAVYAELNVTCPNQSLVRIASHLDNVQAKLLRHAASMHVDRASALRDLNEARLLLSAQIKSYTSKQGM